MDRRTLLVGGISATVVTTTLRPTWAVTSAQVRAAAPIQAGIDALTAAMTQITEAISSSAGLSSAVLTLNGGQEGQVIIQYPADAAHAAQLFNAVQPVLQDWINEMNMALAGI